jgi:hypothetical protein
MGARMANYKIWAEMARRKVRFHPGAEWDEINLWGLFTWGSVRHLLEQGKLFTTMRKENVTIWVTPSREAWENEIKPLIKKYTLEELTTMAGW